MPTKWLYCPVPKKVDKTLPVEKRYRTDYHTWDEGTGKDKRGRPFVAVRVQEQAPVNGKVAGSARLEGVANGDILYIYGHGSDHIRPDTIGSTYQTGVVLTAPDLVELLMEEGIDPANLQQLKIKLFSCHSAHTFGKLFAEALRKAGFAVGKDQVEVYGYLGELSPSKLETPSGKHKFGGLDDRPLGSLKPSELEEAEAHKHRIALH